MAGAVLAALVVVQWTVGPVMVMKALPLELATAHNGVAALLVLAVVALLRFLWTPKTLR
jgi:cytochrome c oxidase assembly protein subunit 15